MELIDTHCHIQSAGISEGERLTREIWAKDPGLLRDSLVAEAVQAGVGKMVCVGCDLEDSKLAVAFAASSNNVWSSIGLHPHEAKDYAQSESARSDFAALASKPRVVAIGECGLDYFYGRSPREDQIEVLKFQFELAAKHDLPMIFHVREAFDDFWPTFDSYHAVNKVRGVLHSFTDTQANLDRAVANGLFIGVNGIATFVKQPEQAAVYRAIPLENMVLETDSPFLTPAPYRGKVNRPERVSNVAEFLSTARNEPLDDVCRATTANAQRLFNF